ncbi:MAG: LCP family protein [Nitriliruptorales bacterium]
MTSPTVHPTSPAVRPARTVRRLVTFAIVSAMSFALLTAAAFAAVTGMLAAPVDRDGMIALLALGSDAGPYRPGSPLSARADAIHLVVISPDRRQVSILDIPRDTQAAVPGRGRTKINACLNGGPERCAQTVAALTGIPIDAWFLTDFRGLQSAIDLFGGLHIDVEQRLRDPFAGTDLQPGPQLLGGGAVLAYSRDRHSRPNGDVGRSVAQSRVLMALHRQILAENPPVIRVAELVELLRRTTVSNARPDLQLRLAYLALTIPAENVRSTVLQGRASSAGGASVAVLTEAAHATIADVRADGILAAS